jgi:hypothetical protein
MTKRAHHTEADLRRYMRTANAMGKHVVLLPDGSVTFTDQPLDPRRDSLLDAEWGKPEV